MRGVPSAQSRKRLAIDLGSAVEMQGSFCQCNFPFLFLSLFPNMFIPQVLLLSKNIY